MLKPEHLVIKDKFTRNAETCQEVLQSLSLFSNRTRFQILCLLREDNFCVSDIADIISESKISNVSQQLKMLTLAGILRKTRREKQVFYQLVDDKIKRLIDFLHTEYID